jgi:hypothetical protein
LADQLIGDALVEELRPVADRVVRELLQRLVRERVEQLLNGDRDEALDVDDGTRVCSRCHVSKAADEFDEGRKTCRRCRSKARTSDSRRRKARHANRPVDDNGAARPAPPLEGELAAAASGQRGERARAIATGERVDPGKPGASALFV